MTRAGLYALAVEALEAGACDGCTQFLTGLSWGSVAALRAALDGEAYGTDTRPLKPLLSLFAEHDREGRP